MSAVQLVRRWSLSSGACELLKWLALLSMFVDHVNAAMFDRSLDWATPIGRVAMPVFALIVGYNLARPGADHSKTLTRLLLFGCLALPAHAFLFAQAVGIWPLNVMFTFAAATGVVILLDRRENVAALALVLVAGICVEYFAVGILVTVLAWRYFGRRDAASLAMLATSVLFLCVVNGNWYALLGAALVASAGTWSLDVPRFRWAFWVAYPAHLLVLAIVVEVSRV